jgi:N-terminal domain of anti-restriction factor ArdC
MAKTKRGPSEAERAERRARDRERLQQAARELLTSDGWQRWVRARALFHNYTLRNCLLLAAQCRERGIDARRVVGFRAWLRLGRCVRKGEKGLVVLAPIPVKRREDGEEPDEARVVFRSAFVFADSQTDPLPGVTPAPIEPPCEPLSGDSHRHLLERLQAFARERSTSRSRWSRSAVAPAAGVTRSAVGSSSTPVCRPTRRCACSCTNSPTHWASAMRSSAGRGPR